jgi:hypothetical protein
LEGGRLRDVSARGQILINSQSALEASIQYERWQFPLLALGPQSNVSASLQLTFTPRLSLHK